MTGGMRLDTAISRACQEWVAPAACIPAIPAAAFPITEAGKPSFPTKTRRAGRIGKTSCPRKGRHFCPALQFNGKAKCRPQNVRRMSGLLMNSSPMPRSLLSSPMRRETYSTMFDGIAHGKEWKGRKAPSSSSPAMYAARFTLSSSKSRCICSESRSRQSGMKPPSLSHLAMAPAGTSSGKKEDLVCVISLAPFCRADARQQSVHESRCCA